MIYLVRTIEGPYYLAKGGEAITSIRGDAFEFETQELADWHVKHTNVFGKLKTVEVNQCAHCQKEFVTWMAGDHKCVVLCPRCAINNLASVIEDSAPDATLKEKSDDEQLGARIRNLGRRS